MMLLDCPKETKNKESGECVMQQFYYGGDILTMEKEGEILEAVLVEEDRIKMAGDFEKVKTFLREDAQWINLQGKTLMPAFIDSHSHISTAIQMSQAADLSQCESFDEIICTLKQYQQKHEIGKSGIIIGFGYDHNFLPEGKQPDKEYLNQVSEEIPIYISHASGHIGCANDAALTLAGITKDTKDPDGGKIGRVAASGEPNGYLEEAAMMLLQKAIAPRIRFDLKEGLKKTQELYLKNGIITVQDGAASAESFAMLRKFDEDEELLLDVVLYPLLQNKGRDLFLNFPQYVEKYHGNLKLGGYKAVLDGSPQGRSAWLTKPYENSDGYCAYPWFSNKETEAFMETAIEDSRQILVHCNGDAAGDQFINAYKKALEKSKNPDKDKLRPVMIHCQTVREDQLDEMAETGIIPSIFVGHVYYWGEVHRQNLGEDRAVRISPCKSAFSRNMKVTFHQDTPVTKPDMLHSVWCGVNRMTRSGNILGSEQCCTVYEALQAVTINGAYAYFEEKEKGSIKEGKRADFVILDKNPMKTEQKMLKEIQVLETIKAGKSVWKKEDR